ncbi:MAG: beta-N-acetylhexosaminidase [Proteobacteria bacterium]|nr:beta-N-acetylhexosaminidase [Pseudomonadota bacterium]MDA0993424.1 beta-N-acetylhexosaminidase [Pseudomonadota bacterium]
MALGPVMLDIEGSSLSPADRTLLREPAVGGVILFSRNYESPSQLSDLVGAIRAVRTPPLLVAVDHEGGRVQRFRDGFTPIPPMRDLGRQFDSDMKASLSLARTVGWVIASELRAMDIDLAFAPCVDLDWGVSEIIGNRAFHRKPGVVSDLASAFSRGLRDGGMAAVAKHFPGHGAVVPDSHEQLPVDRRSYGDLLDDMRPYEKLIGARQLAGVMLAHIVYSELDPVPAGFSAYWIQNQLRGQLGYDGAVFCDDLSMKATRKFGSMAKRARLALDAGCDMILVCNDRPAAMAAVASLRDYSNPLSLVRLARLHGTGHVMRETLLASDEWQAATGRINEGMGRPALRLNA